MATGALIGVDLGGTNLRAAEVRPDGSLGATRRAALDHRATAPFGQLVAMVSELSAAMRPLELAGIGVSVTGPVDPLTGWVDNPHTLPPSMQGDLGGALEAAFAVPTALENDANAAALGEVHFGCGRHGSVVMCVTVGTGIGVGVVAGGEVYAGAGRAHPEAGHVLADPGGPPCYCGASGCLESMASASAITRAARAAGVVGSGASAEDVFAAAASGHDVARAVIDRAWDALARGVRTLTAAYAPDVVVLAGGALGQGDAVTRRVATLVHTFPFGAANVDVRRSTLGDWAGCIGAASMLMPSRVAHEPGMSRA